MDALSSNRGTDHHGEASAIQGAYRRYKRRVGRKRSLDEKSIRAAETAIEKRAFLQRAPTGLTPVFFLPTAPVVLKQSGAHAVKRKQQMERGAQICRQLGLSHLVIPPAHIQGEFLVEERLPLGDIRDKSQRHLYVSHLEEFSPAICEFTTFCMRTQLGDTQKPDMLAVERGRLYHSGRYDNVPLYCQNGNYYLGLIDLERSNLADPLEEQFLSFQELQVTLPSVLEGVVALFPYHTDEILETVYDNLVKKFGRTEEVEIFFRELSLKLRSYAKESVLPVFEVDVYQHAEFLKERHIGPDNSKQKLELSKERKEVIAHRIVARVVDAFQKPHFGNQDLKQYPFLRDPDRNKAFLETVLPVWIDIIMQALNETLEQNHAKGAVHNVTGLLQARSLYMLHNATLLAALTRALQVALMEEDVEQDELSEEEYEDQLTDRLALMGIVRNIATFFFFEELQREGIISYFNPNGFFCMPNYVTC